MRKALKRQKNDSKVLAMSGAHNYSLIAISIPSFTRTLDLDHEMVVWMLSRLNNKNHKDHISEKLKCSQTVKVSYEVKYEVGALF